MSVDHNVEVDLEAYLQDKVPFTSISLNVEVVQETHP